jgi:hypothetical protein
MLKYFCVPALAVAVCLPSMATAAAKKKAQPNLGPAQLEESVSQQQCPGGFKFASGGCLAPAQAEVLLAARAMGNCMAQTRMNYNWCPVGPTAAPRGKDIFVFDQSGFGVASSPGGAASDIRLKLDIAQLAELQNGIKLYKFRYIWSDQVYVGVMAQQVAAIVPDAVSMQPNGYLYVNYDRLGMKMQTWEEYEAKKSVVSSQ